MNKKIKIAAMSDLHIEEDYSLSFKKIFEEISEKADILILCGDLTRSGLVKEAEILAEDLRSCRIPIVGVLGNHDYTNDKENEIRKILSGTGMFILGKEPFVYKDFGFAGVKGFCGGFDKHLTAPFGEKILKEFVMEAVNETIQLRESLIKLETEKKIVILHYAPIRDTVAGESLEIYPMLGTSRLIEPIEDFNVTAVFHGHSHHGTAKGKTPKGIPVYNVSYPLLSKLEPNKGYIIVEI